MIGQESYKLVIDGYEFHSTWQLDEKGEAEKVIANYKEHHNEVLVLRGFGVDVQTANPETREVLTWDRVTGYSLWKPGAHPTGKE